MAKRSSFGFTNSAWSICAGLVLCILAGYTTVFWCDFVNYDDPNYATQNTHVQSGLTREGVVWAFTTAHASNWHPLTWLSHMLDAQIFGMNPGGHHFTSLLLHAVNSLLLFLLLKKLTGAFWRSAFVAALFAIHPLHVESVAWISERKDVLSTLFLLLTLWTYANFAKSETRSSKSAVRDYLLALLFFALGLMSKPMLVTVPFLLLLLDWWPLERFKAEGSKFQTVRRVILEKLPFLGLAAVSSAVTFIAQRKGGAVTSLASLSLLARVENAIVSYARYLWKTVWPVKLSILYPHPIHWPVWQVILATAILILFSGVAIWFAKQRKYLLAGWLWFLGSLVPVIGIVQVGLQSMADRYTYIPLIGIFVALVWAIADMTQNWRGQKIILGSIGAMVLFACTALTAKQVGYWKDSEALFRRAIEVTQNNFLAYNNLGFHLANHGQLDEAIENYRLALKYDANYEDALNNLGHAFAEQGKNQEAVPYYEAALRIRPRHVEVNNNFGNALAALGRGDEAIAHYEVALAADPHHADSHNNLGIALAMKGKLTEAIEHFKQALAAKANNASAHSNLGNAYAALGRFAEAIQEYEASLKLDPRDTQVQNNLGNVFAEQGRLDDAVTHYRASLRFNAKNSEAHCNLGIALGRLKKTDEARAQFTEALRLRPDYPEAQRQLRALEASDKK